MDDTPTRPPGDELDSLLCRLALADPATGRRLEAPEDAAADRLLDAYRGGELAPAQRRELEARLRREPQLRRRLAERAGIAPGAPAAVRRRVLAQIAPRRRRVRKLGWLAAALALGLGLTLLRSPQGLPPELEYRVEVRGIASSRDAPESGGAVEALAGTVVRLVARPERSSQAEVDFAVYRSEAGRLRRIDPAAVDLVRHGAAATLSARAGDLAGEAAGVHGLFLVVARPGDLPDSVAPRPGEQPRQALAAGDRRRAYPFSIHLLPRLPAAPPNPGGTEP